MESTDHQRSVGLCTELIDFSFVSLPSGFQRRRLIPAPLPDASLLGRNVGGQWVDLPPLSGTLKEPFEIKVYEIDDVERLQRRREVLTGSEVRRPPSSHENVHIFSPSETTRR